MKSLFSLSDIIALGAGKMETEDLIKRYENWFKFKWMSLSSGHVTWTSKHKIEVETDNFNRSK